MYIGLVILGIVAWIIVALWPARVASRKGYSFLLYFLISIPFFWITVFVAYALKDRTAPTAPVAAE
jgi:hypothetical protein